MRSWFVALVALALLSTAEMAAGQGIEVPSFEVARPTIENHVGSLDVAVAPDGTLLFLYSEYGSGSPNTTKALTARLAADGTPLGAPIRVDTQQHVSGPKLVADTRGAYVAAWEVVENRHHVHGRLLSSSGAGLGPELEIDSPDAFGSALSSGVAAMSTGSAFFWKQGINQLWGRTYDVNGNPRGEQFPVSDQDGATGFDLDADTMPDGGFVVAWQSSFSANKTSARVYHADGQPRGPVLPVDATGLSNLRVAASPTGGFAVAGNHWDGVDSVELWVRRFTDDGVLLWEALVDQPPPGVTDRGDLAFDTLGNVYVAWGSHGGDGPNRPRARGLDAGGVPLGGAIDLDGSDTATSVRVARTANGTSFVTGWNRYGQSLRAAVVALCGPGSSVCGNAIVDSQCEQCDLGAGNSDTTPNTCRSNCRRPHCGDGVLDDHEQCDDGDVVSCDGCSAVCELEPGHVCGDGILDPTCNEECDEGPANGDVADTCRTTCRLPRCGDGIVDSIDACDDGNFAGCDGCTPSCVVETGLVCGDGVAEAGCNESCDDGNQTSADGCSAACVAERIPGGGKPATDCYTEWSIRNVGNLPYLDKHGAISGQQACTDDDASCDGDGGTPGSCTFSVRACGNNTDLTACAAPLRLASWELRNPSASKASHDPNAASIRAAFAATVPGALLGPTTRDICAPAASVTVQLRGAPGAYKPAKLKLKSRARAYDDSQDTDTLTLICRPAQS